MEGLGEKHPEDKFMVIRPCRQYFVLYDLNQMSSGGAHAMQVPSPRLWRRGLWGILPQTFHLRYSLATT